jgi:hypothetical protein
MIDINTIIITQILKDEKNLEVAFETWKAFNSSLLYKKIQENFVSKLIEKINQELKDKFNLEVDEYEFLDKSESKLINIQWIINRNTWTDKFKFGIYDNDGDRLFFSIECLNENEQEKLSAHTKIKTFLKEGHDYKNQWWSKVKEPYNRWEGNLEGLKQFAFCDKNALDYLSNKVCSFVKLVEQQFQLNQNF